MGLCCNVNYALSVGVDQILNVDNMGEEQCARKSALTQNESVSRFAQMVLPQLLFRGRGLSVKKVGSHRSRVLVLEASIYCINPIACSIGRDTFAKDWIALARIENLLPSTQSALTQLTAGHFRLMETEMGLLA